MAAASAAARTRPSFDRRQINTQAMAATPATSQWQIAPTWAFRPKLSAMIMTLGTELAVDELVEKTDIGCKARWIKASQGAIPSTMAEAAIVASADAAEAANARHSRPSSRMTGISRAKCGL